MQLRVLGPTQVVLGDGPVDLGARKPRSVLAALALRLGGDLAPDALVDLVWGDDAPRGAHGTLHSYLSGLRRVLEPGLGPRERPTVLVTSDHGYRLELRREQVDAHRFADEVRAHHRALAPLTSQFTSGPTAGWPGRAAISAHVDGLEGLLALWTGEAYADLPDGPEVTLARSALDQLRLGAEEDRVLGLLALGDHAVVVAATEQATRRHPLQERLWALHALALARSGRQAEALAALREIRGMLAEELGIDPGQELQLLEQSLLRQDPALQEWLRPTATTTATTTATAPAPGGPTGWSTVGRAAELSALEGVLDRAQAGSPAYAVVVGEPGIGKSRLVGEVTRRASERGFAVAVGPCSQDEGAPPLWPWTRALAELGVEADTGPAFSPGTEEAAAFQAWEELAAAVRERAAGQPVLLVLEDLHWADSATLRVLRHLLATTPDGTRLAVVVTRRHFPEPAGAAAEAAEELARQHAVRLEPAGLGDADAAALVAEVTGAGAELVGGWLERSGGNPFFLVELARLHASGSDEDVPASVRDVVVRRLQALPDPTRALLVLAAVVGRRFSLDLLAAAAEEDVDTVDDRLEPARQAGLVEDPAVGYAAFAHALVRDAVAGTVRATRLARLHARVARALDSDPAVAAVVGAEERTSELARHWLAAGPAYAPQAWRSADAAARQARRSFSFPEAAATAAAAVEAHRRDPHGTPEERYDLLLDLASDCRVLADFELSLPPVAEAVALARQDGDVERLARAAAMTSHNCVWTPMGWEVVLEDLVEDLRWALAQVPAGDSPTRCRLMLALAVQLYYDPSARAEKEALAEEGAAMATRLGETALVWWATHTAWLALWDPGHLPRRQVLARDGLAAAQASGDPASEVVALLQLAGTCAESGDRAAFTAAMEEAVRLARQRRNSYALVAALLVELSLRAMRGTGLAELRTELVERRPRDNALVEQVFLAAVHTLPALWDGTIGDHLGPMGAVDWDSTDFGRQVYLVALSRAGAVEELRAQLRRPIRNVVVNWCSSDIWACQAEAAFVAGDTGLAAEMVERLTPLSGRIVTGGIASLAGPVDGYLALALHASGDPRAAAPVLERALVQAAEWDLPLYTRWLQGRRRQL